MREGTHVQFDERDFAENELVAVFFSLKHGESAGQKKYVPRVTT